MIQLSKKRQNALVGLEIEAGSIAAAEVVVNGTARLGRTAIAPLPAQVFSDGEVGDPGRLAEGLRAMFAESGLPKRVRLGIANQWTVVRTLRLPAIEDPAELEAAVQFQAQEQIPMPIEQAVLDHKVVGGTPGEEGAPPQVDVVVVAARRDMILSLLRPLRDAGLEPQGVDLSAFGMIRALGANGAAVAEAGAADSAPGATLFYQLGEMTNLAIALDRTCLFTRVSPVGLEGIATELSGATGAPIEHARMWLTHVGLGRPLEQIEGDTEMIAKSRTAMEAGVSSLLDELRMSLDYYGAQEDAPRVERIVLCGPGSAIPGLPEHMQSILGIPFALGRPEALSGLDEASAARLTLPFGLALEG
ncbi:MAG: type IV pilus assembly protein PilM [Solirubrobacterales bacterium]